MPVQSLVQRFIAGFLAIVGTTWASLLVFTFLLPKAGIILNLIFLPGWGIFACWYYIAFGKSAELNFRQFWLVSATINVAYLLLQQSPWKVIPSIDRMTQWWIIATILSLVAFITAPKNAQNQAST